MKKITIAEFVQIIKEFIPVNVNIVKAARHSTLNTINNKDLKSIVTMWNEGWYDDHPEEAILQIKKLLKIR